MKFADEDRLLILCSRACIDGAAAEQAAAILRGKLDWSYVLEASIQHGVSPLLFRGLAQVCGAQLDRDVPPEVLDELRSLHGGNQSRNRRLYRVIGEVARSFKSAGIDVLGLKDLQLARVVYPDPGLRPIGDIDLLVRRSQYPAIVDCLAKLGFHPPAREMPYILKYAWAHHLRREEDDVWLDVQWNVMQIEWDISGEGNFDFEIERMWRNAEPLAIDDSSILVPSPEDMLFHLCMHLEGHRYCELVLFCDIAQWLHHYANTARWDYFLAINEKYGTNSSAYYVLALTRQLFEAPVPAWVLERLRPAYFKANLFGPLFGNLTVLHHGLEDIRSCASPPPAVLRGFEVEARAQAIAAQRIYRELESMAASFTASGPRVLLFDGAPSPRVYPDAAVEAFGSLDVHVLREDLPAFLDTLAGRGFEVAGSGASWSLHKEWEARSADAALVSRPIPLRVSGRTRCDLRGLLGSLGKKQPSKADLALRQLAAKLRHTREAHPVVEAPLRVIALSPESLLVYLASRLGRQSRDTLFGLCTLLEFFRACPRSLDWRKVDACAAAHGVEAHLRRGLGLVAGLLGTAVPGSLMPGVTGRPRLLESARYDLEQTSRYTTLKAGYLFCLTLLSVPGLKGKLRYLGASLARERTNPVLGRFLIETLKHSLRKFAPPPDDRRRFAYWIERPREAPPAGDLARAGTELRQMASD